MDLKTRIYSAILIISLLVISTVYPQDRKFYSQNYTVPSKFISYQIPSIRDQLTTPDKAQHFMGSLISTVLLYKVFQDPLQIDNSKSKVLAVGITLGLGISKEFYDKSQSKGIFSWMDLIANVAGITVGLVLVNQP